MSRLKIIAALSGLGLLCAGPALTRAADVPQPSPDIRVRDGYVLSVAEATIQNPRFMCLGGSGELYVSLPGEGEIKACRDQDGDGYFETVATFVKGHRSVHGLCWHDGWLWFTETGAIFKARDTDGDGRADDEQAVIPKGKLPSAGGHWWRPILIHNNRIYTGIGDDGNINDRTDSPREKLWSYALDGSDEQPFCAGIRNTEKLVVRPGTDEIWGMDHGSDWYGGELEKKAKAGQPITDMNPPCEMNHYVQGRFYGHPFVVGNRLPRIEYMDRPDIVELAAKTVPPEWCTGAHWAPNAMCFYTGTQFRSAAGSAFVAYHGSWNRSEKGGYCVTLVLFEDGHPYGEQPYVRFLSSQGDVLGRPVDIVQAPDGSLLISDDQGNRIYRLRAKGAGA